MLSLRVLGATGLTRADGVEVQSVLAQPKRFALLVYLALAAEPGALIRRDTLQAMFWPDSDEARARGSLRMALHFLRRSLGDAVVTARGRDELGVEPSALACDARAFEAALEAGRGAEAMSLYAGELLPGFGVPGAAAFEDWLDRERTRLARRAAETAAALAERAEAERDLVVAIGWCRRAVELRPLEEPSWRRLMALLAHSGDRGGALGVYETLSTRLAADLGVEPSGATRALAEAIRAGDASVAADGDARRGAMSGGEIAVVAAGPAPRGTSSEVPGTGHAVARPTAAVDTAARGAGVDATVGAGAPRGAEPDAAAAAPAPLMDPAARRDAEPAAGPATTARWGARLRGRRAAAVFATVATAAVAVWAVVGAAAGSGSLDAPAPAVAGAGNAAAPAAGRIAVLPFSVRGYTRYDYLGEGVVELLSAALDGAGDLRAVDPRAVLAALRVERAGEGREADGAAVGLGTGAGTRLAGRLSARLYVLGGIVATERSLQLSASLYDASARAPVAVASVEGPADAVFQLVDSLAVRLVAGRWKDPGKALDRAAARSTPALPTLKSYLQGTQALREGKFHLAADLLSAALAADSTFALAAYELSLAEEMAGYRERPELLARALRHVERLSPHERLLLEARAARPDPPRAERLYREILARYPDDVEAWNQLGEVLFHSPPAGEAPFAPARAAFERVISYEPGHGGALQHLARIAAVRRDATAVDSLTRRARASGYEGEIALEMLALRWLALGDSSARAELLPELRRAPDNRVWITAWRAAVYAENFADARELLGVLVGASRSEPVRAYGHVGLAFMAMAAGRPAAAGRSLARADSLRPGLALPVRIGFSLMPLRPARCRDADSLADALGSARPVDDIPPGLPSVERTRVGAANPAAWRRYLGLVLRGCREGVPATLETLARLRREDDLSLRGSFDSWIRSVLAPGPALAARAPDGLDYASASVLAPAVLRRATQLEQAGDRRAAAAAYRRFAHVWRAAEPALQPLVADALERAARLDAEAPGDADG